MTAPIQIIAATNVATSGRPRFAICTLGCKLNQSDEEEIRTGLRQAGLREVDFADDAEVYIVNTCTVTHLADRRSRQMLRRARRQNPDALVAAIGCYPAVAPDELEAMPEVDLVVGSVDKAGVVDEVLARLGIPHAAFDVEALPGPAGDETRTRRMIKIQEGCRAHCTYCVIPQARGGPRNKSPEHVVSEVQEAVDAGYREVVLTGTHVGTYKWATDSGVLRLADLLELVLDRTPVERLRVTSVGPHEIDEHFIQILSHPRMAPHLHLALQSGSEAVLRRMKRWYNTTQFRRAVRELRKALPDIGITTDVIVGFPGETDAEFAETCAFVSEMAFSRVHVFPFSPRRGTPAAVMPGQVPPRVKQQRSATLRAIGEELQQAFSARHVGSELRVLLEQVKQEENDGAPLWSGLTGNYLRVYVPGALDLANRMVTVRAVAPFADGVLASAPIAVS